MLHNRDLPIFMSRPDDDGLFLLFFACETFLSARSEVDFFSKTEKSEVILRLADKMWNDFIAMLLKILPELGHVCFLHELKMTSL